MTKTFNELMREARASIREVWPDGRAGRLAAAGARIVDVREQDEWEQGHIPGAVHLAKSYIEQEIEAAVPDRSAPLVLYCAGGVRSLLAARELREMGYAKQFSMAGGFRALEVRGTGVDPAGGAGASSRSAATAATC